MNKKDFKFLNSKLLELVDNDIITDQQCVTAQNYFAIKKENKSLSTIFAALGVFLIALSIITLFAMNWDSIGKTLKVIIAFVPITITGVLLYKYLRTDNKKLQLYTSIFAPVSILATNSLLSQIFHMQTEIFELFFTSLLMFMPIAFILFNKLALIVYCCGTAFYSMIAIEAYGSEGEALLRCFILTLPILISNLLLYRKDKEDHRNILMWITNVFLVSLLVFYKELISPESILMYFYMLYFLTQMLFSRNNPLNKVLSFGFIYYLLLSCTTAELLEFAEEITPQIDTLLITALTGIFIYFSDAYKHPKEYFIFIFMMLVQFTGFPKEILFVLVNLLALSLGIYKIVIGNQKGYHKEIKQGLALVLLLIAFRFVSADLSFGTKSIIFLLAGIAFLFGGKIIKKRIGGNTND